MNEADYLAGLPEELKERFKAMPSQDEEAMQVCVEQATEHMQNVIRPMLAFQYPERPSLPRSALKSDVQYNAFKFESVRLNNGVVETKTRSAKYFVEVIAEGVSLEMVYIPEGSFIMGSSEEGESPEHSVAVPAFHIGKFEVTQQQWTAIMHHNLSAQKGEELPVENVSWLDANEFCIRLSLLTGKEYRLPSEAEWEYACRAGTTTRYSFGDEITAQVANYWDTETTGGSGFIALESTPVGSFYANDFGLYDMHGNVYELCQDTFRWDYTDAPTDGSPFIDSESPESVTIRGGSCVYYADNCRSAYRNETGPDYRYGGTGFRVACSLS